MRLSIQNFGPIKDCQIQQINDFTVFIGEQASGKSTICKVIYFCLGMRNDLIELLEMIRNDAYEATEEPFKWLMKREKYKFIHFFGPTYNVSAFKINFKYKSGNSIDIRLNDSGGKSFLYLELNQELKTAIWTLINESKQQADYYKEMRKNAGIASYEKRIEIDFRKDTDRTEMIKRVEKLFGEERELIYMPSARSIPSMIGFSSRDILQILGERSFIKPDRFYRHGGMAEYTERLDYISKQFLSRIYDEIKPRLKNGIDGLKMIESMIDKETSEDQHRDLYLREARQLIKEILKGDYRFENEQDVLYVNEGKTPIRLNHASSGQQESVWILNLIYLIMFDNVKCIIFIEEPETHIYTNAQADIMKLITLFFNYKRGNMVFITTHSPYLLANVCNSMYAGKVARESELKSRLESIIPSKFWLDPANVDVYKIVDGKICSIKSETELIYTEQLDESLLNELMQTFTSLGDMEDGNG